MISVFNPLISEFLWEVNINSPIKDFNFIDDGKLLILSNKIFLFLIMMVIYKILLPILNENPLKLLRKKIKYWLSNQKGIEILDIKTVN